MEPFRKILQEELVKVKRIDDRGGWESLEEPLKCSHRFIWQIVTPGRQETLSFQTADRIICAFKGGLLGWMEDAELRAIYEGVNLHYLDWIEPVTDSIRADQDRLILDLYSDGEKGYRAIADEIGCSAHRVAKVISEYRAQRKKAA